MSSSTSRVPNLPLRGDVEIPQLGFGVFKVPPEDTAEVVTRALQTGYRHIDTATAYRNEAGVGQAIRAAGLDRGEVFVTTKCFNDDHGTTRPSEPARRASTVSSSTTWTSISSPGPCRRTTSTSRPGRRSSSCGPGAGAVDGVSNFQPAHLERVIAETGVTPAVNQVELHPLLQQPGLRREHEELGIVTEAWSPLARGEVLEDPAIAEIAEAHGKTPGQVVIRWHIQLGNVVIPKSVSPERMPHSFARVP